jgi:hypothetical protein
VDLTPLVGNVPEWAGATAALIGLRRKSRIKEFFDEMVASGLTPERLARAVSESERLGDLLFEASNISAVCEDQQRRILLARAVAQGIEEGISIDDAQFFIHAIREVNPVHMKLLSMVAARGGVSSQQMEIAWPEAVGVLKPIRALLDREGLIEDVS